MSDIELRLVRQHVAVAARSFGGGVDQLFEQFGVEQFATRMRCRDSSLAGTALQHLAQAERLFGDLEALAAAGAQRVFDGQVQIRIGGQPGLQGPAVLGAELIAKRCEIGILLERQADGFLEADRQAAMRHLGFSAAWNRNGQQQHAGK